MAGTLRAHVEPDGVHFAAAGTAETTVDVHIAGRRVWSCKAPATGYGVVPWPEALLPRLIGAAECEVHRASDDRPLWRGEVRWSDAADGPDLRDALGRDVVVNKWGRISHSFAGDGAEAQRRILTLASRVLQTLEGLGFPTFAVGGTLLGAVRSSALLPHDDDADLAYLSEHSHPSDLVVENARVEAALGAIGLRVVRHSWAHLQVAETVASGETEFYVDVFTAFFRNGEFCEPIHVRVPEREVRILPLSSVRIGDETFPAPADPAAWLAACYGPDWRTPDPGFAFETPRDTVRRFYAWFGNYNLHRNTWQEAYLAGDPIAADVPIPEFERRVVEAAGPDGTVLDLGSGSGESALRLQRSVRSVRCFDYAWAAPCHSHESVTSRVVNLRDYAAAVGVLREAIRAERAAGATRIVVAVNRLLAGQDPTGRAEIFAVIGFLLRAGARVLVCEYATLGDYEFERPTSWHLPEVVLLAECADRGLAVERLRVRELDDERGVRRSAGIYELREAGPAGSRADEERKR